jgi:hypothetical protein
VRFTEIDVFGVYVAPMSLMMVVAWLVTVALRGAAAKKYQERRQVTQNVGHMLVDLPTGCEFGAKKNSKGYKGSARLAALPLQTTYVAARDSALLTAPWPTLGPWLCLPASPCSRLRWVLRPSPAMDRTDEPSRLLGA